MALRRARKNTLRPVRVGMDANIQSIPKRRRLRITRKGAVRAAAIGVAIPVTGLAVRYGVIPAAVSLDQRIAVGQKARFDSGQFSQVKKLYPWLQPKHLTVLKKISEVSGRSLSETAITLNQIFPDSATVVHYPSGIEKKQLVLDVKGGMNEVRHNPRYAAAVDSLITSMHGTKGSTQTLDYLFQAERARQKSKAAIDSLKAKHDQDAKRKIKTYSGTR